MKVQGWVPRFAAPRNHIVSELASDSHEPTYYPALRSDRTRENPLKYMGPYGVYDANQVSQAINYVVSKLKTCGFTTSQPDGFDECISNVAEWNSSPGYPHVLESLTKREMFQKREAEMRRDFASNRTSGFSSDIPKPDELLKLGKRIRQLTAVEFPLMLLQSSYCTKFNKQLKVNSRFLPIKLGVSKSNGGWNDIIQLMMKCTRGLSQDASGHDTSVPAQLLRAVRDIRLAFLDLTDKEKTVFIELYENIIQKNVVDLDGFVFGADGGVPSGYLCTSEDNSLLSWLLVILFFMHHYGSRWEEALDSFVLLIYGDDVWYGHRRHAEFKAFEPEELKMFFWGKNYQVKCEKWLDPFAADFLSCVVVDHPGIGPVNIQVRFEKLYDAMFVVDDAHYTDYEVRFGRLLALRDELAGTPRFKDAEQRLLKWWSIVPASFKTPIMLKSFSTRRNELGVLRVRMGLANYQGGGNLNIYGHPNTATSDCICSHKLKPKTGIFMSSAAVTISTKKARKRRTRKSKPVVNLVVKPKGNKKGKKKVSGRRKLQGTAVVAKASALGADTYRVHQVRHGSMNEMRLVGNDTIVQVNDHQTFTRVLNEAINPLNSNLFPRAVGIASLYEQWKLGPGGIKLRYVQSCPTSRSGIIGAYWEADVVDTVEPTNMQQLMLQAVKFSGALYSDHAMQISPSSENEKWYYTQSSLSNTQADRNAFYGEVRAYTSSCVSADDTAFSGYLQISYDFMFKNFRTPSVTGFATQSANVEPLTNNSQRRLAWGDGTSAGNTGVFGQVYQYLTDLIKTPTPWPAVGNPSTNRVFTPPLNQPLSITFQGSLGPDSVSNSSHLISPRNVGVDPLSDDWSPYESRCDEKGVWFYRESPGGALVPYPEVKDFAPENGVRYAHPGYRGKRVGAFGDYTFSIVAFDTAGNGTIIASVSGSTINAVTNACSAIFSTSAITYLIPTATVAISAARAVIAVRGFVNFLTTQGND